MSIVDSAKQKAGPLPVYGWVLIIGGGIAILIWYRNKHAAANSSSNSTPSTTSSTGVSEDQYAAGEIAADYDLKNQLALNRGTETTLASNVGKDVTAQEANTRASNKNTSRVAANTKATAEDTKADKADVQSDRHKPVRRRHPVNRHHKQPVRHRITDGKR